MGHRRFFAVSALSLGVLFATTAHAEWTKAENFEFSASTSLKITEPHDAKVFVTIGGETKEATLPAIFPMPDADAYVPVKIVAADGDTWSGKVEIKARRQTVVKFAHTPKAAAPTASTQKFIGQFQNWTHLCARLAERETLKFVAMRDGKAAYEATLAPNRAQSNIELPPGKYSVRVFRRDVFVQAKELEVSNDGWVFTWGCK